MRKLYLLLCAVTLAFSTFQCSSAYKLEKESVLKPHRPYFHSWIAEIKQGGSGFNLYFPNLNPNGKVLLDSVYFRGIKGKLVKGRAMYSANLKNPSPYERDMSIEAAFKKEEKSKFPFKLTNMDCVISYVENGETKYYKVAGLTEKKGIYNSEGLAVQDIGN